MHRGITWSWRRALVGAVYAIPAVVVALDDPTRGVPLALGVLPAALLPVAPRRRDRVVVLVVGVLAGISLFLGGVLTHLPELVTAVVLAGCVVAAALLSARLPAGRLVLVLCVPLVAVGTSYDDYAHAVGGLALLSAGAAYAWLVSLAWPSGDGGNRRSPVLPSRDAMLAYGIRLGLAAGIAYLVAVSLALDHPGWAPAACLLVARPQPDLLRTRGVGRIVAVVVGAASAALVLHATPPDAVYAILAAVVVVLTAGTAGSRWYITSAFTTFLVFLMLLLDDPQQASQKFDERVGETVLGVGLAYVFVWALPALRASGRRAPGG